MGSFLLKTRYRHLLNSLLDASYLYYLISETILKSFTIRLKDFFLED